MPRVPDAVDTVHTVGGRKWLGAFGIWVGDGGTKTKMFDSAACFLEGRKELDGLGVLKGRRRMGI